MGKLESFILKHLEPKFKTRKTIDCDDFFTAVAFMGIEDDDPRMVKIMDYLDVNGVDINFHDAKTGDFYRRYKSIEQKVKLSKMLNGTKTEIQKLIEKVDSVKVEERPDWLEHYRDDDDDKTPITTSDRDRNLGQDIIDRLTSEIRDRIDSEPGITLEEVQREVENEMVSVPPNFNMSQLRGSEEIIQFLTNRVIPERLRQ
jgi:hypothetical protein